MRNPTFVTLSDGTIRNAYDLRLRNKHHEPRDFALSFTADAPLNLHVEGTEGIAVTVPADETQEVRLYLDAAPGTAAAVTSRMTSPALIRLAAKHCEKYGASLKEFNPILCEQ